MTTMTPVSRMVPLDAISLDSETQAREAIDHDTVNGYRDALEAGAEFPPAVLFWDGRRHWVGDGFHRILANRLAKRSEVCAIVLDGGRRDAILYAVGANSDHGLRRSNADKRRAATIMLKDEEWRKWTDGAIADRCHVSQSLVNTIRHELYPPNFKLGAIRQTRNGRLLDTTNLGRPPAATPEWLDKQLNGHRSNGAVTDAAPGPDDGTEGVPVVRADSALERLAARIVERVQGERLVELIRLLSRHVPY